MGRHPNTLRKYEVWGFIDPVPRGENGYRRYSRAHVLQALFAVAALRTCFEDWRGRRRVKAMVARFRDKAYAACGAELAAHRAELEAALAIALEAKAILEAWRKRGPTADAPGVVYRGQAARLGKKSAHLAAPLDKRSPRLFRR